MAGVDQARGRRVPGELADLPALASGIRGSATAKEVR